MAEEALTQDELEYTEEVSETTEEQEQPEQKVEQKPEEKYVPYGALHEERMRRKEMAEQLKQYEEKVNKMEDRFGQLVNQFKEPEPNYDDDPATYLKHQTENINERLQSFEQQQQQAHQQAQWFNNLQQKMTGIETDFVQQNPDYHDAINHLRTVRMQDYQGMGITDQGQIQNALTQDAVFVINAALQAERNPAQALYDMAKRYGFQGKQSDQIKQMQETMSQAETLGPSGGGDDKLTLEAIANMDESEFAKLSEEDWQRLLGG